jgi:TatD DNase family protein
VRLYEAHAHFQDPKLAAHWPALAESLQQFGIVEAVCNGTSPGDWQAVAELGRKHPWIRPSFGLHPWHVGNVRKGWLEDLRRLLLADSRAVVGEIGLDLWMLNNARADDPRLAGLARATLDVQEDAFVAQLGLAAELRRPPTVHGLNAWDRLEQILNHARLPRTGFLLHAFSGPSEKVPAFIDAGAYFSFNGYFLSSRYTRVREMFIRLPLDRLLVETDAPSMSLPEINRRYTLPSAADGSAPNHPGNLGATYTALADIRGMSVAALADAVEENFNRLFGQHAS